MATELITPLFGIPVGPEVLVIVLIAILLFGANKIPELARSTGEAMGEFQKGREEVEQELEQMKDGATGSPSSSGPSAPNDTGAGISEAEPGDDVDAEDSE